eukprot:Skav206364  [mRNA]  locus=scaffold3448:376046:386369:- [translate_table: standard]
MVRSLPFYDVNYTARPLEQSWTDWKRWQQGSADPAATRGSADPSEFTAALDQRVAEVKSQLSLKVPGAITGLPSGLSLTALPAKGKGQMGELWGALPKRMELKAFPDIGMDGADPQDLDLWHRENWTAGLMQNCRSSYLLTPEILPSEAALPSMLKTIFRRCTDGTEPGTSLPSWTLQEWETLREANRCNGGLLRCQVLSELVQKEEEVASAERLKRLRRELKMELEDQSEAILSVAVRERNILLMPETYARHELLNALVEGRAGGGRPLSVLPTAARRPSVLWRPVAPAASL